ncbi:MAG: hypothetical protein H6838_03555 [Planctomycetes bacterium]|nr:hypothetical protein [Planctomycetota bacterium]
MMAVSLLLAAGCGGSLSHRSVADMVGGELPLEAAVQRIRVEVPTGTVGVAAGSGRTLRYGGGVRRAADTAEDLARLEAIPLELTAVLDAKEPGTLVVKAPGIGVDDPKGVFGLELGLHVPPGIPLEVKIAGSGNVTLDHRNAATKVTTARGDLRVQWCAGALEASTRRGNVIVIDHAGDVDVDVGVGDLQVFVKQPDKLIRLVTGQGSLQCHVPGSTDLELDAAVAIGHISNGFGFHEEKTGDYSAAMRGKRGDGRTKIVLRSGAGTVSMIPKAFGEGSGARQGLDSMALLTVVVFVGLIVLMVVVRLVLRARGGAANGSAER